MSPAPIPKYTGKEWTVEPLDLSFDEAVTKIVQPIQDKEAGMEEKEEDGKHQVAEESRQSPLCSS